jgi:hypothetical protein
MKLDPEIMARALNLDHHRRGQNSPWNELPEEAREVYRTWAATLVVAYEDVAALPAPEAE